MEDIPRFIGYVINGNDPVWNLEWLRRGDEKTFLNQRRLLLLWVFLLWHGLHIDSSIINCGCLFGGYQWMRTRHPIPIIIPLLGTGCLCPVTPLCNLVALDRGIWMIFFLGEGSMHTRATSKEPWNASEHFLQSKAGAIWEWSWCWESIIFKLYWCLWFLSQPVRITTIPRFS